MSPPRFNGSLEELQATLADAGIAGSWNEEPEESIVFDRRMAAYSIGGLPKGHSSSKFRLRQRQHWSR
jgi:hypothetical protein